MKTSFASRYVGEKFRKKVQKRNAAILDMFAVRVVLVAAEARATRTPIHPSIEAAVERLAEMVKTCPTPSTFEKPPDTWIEDFDAKTFEANCGPSAPDVENAVARIDDATRFVRFGAEMMSKAGRLGVAEDFDSYDFNQAIDRLRAAVRKFEGARS